MQLLPILVAVIASMLVGYFWYSPYAVGNVWMSLIGMTKEKMKTRQRGMALPLFVSVLSAFLVASVFQRAQVDVRQMITVVLMLWLVFCVALRLPNFLFEGRSLRLFLIYAGHDLLNLMVIGLIISLWK